ncbi:hypothetical protein NHQ30_000271 [Ciborinia camelliae]|nr:hypothetical protein NHQ30_000271 [Ciborinia camelliae]
MYNQYITQGGDRPVHLGQKALATLDNGLESSLDFKPRSIVEKTLKLAEEKKQPSENDESFIIMGKRW